jgi:hypothetical protein
MMKLTFGMIAAFVGINAFAGNPVPSVSCSVSSANVEFDYRSGVPQVLYKNAAGQSLFDSCDIWPSTVTCARNGSFPNSTETILISQKQILGQWQWVLDMEWYVNGDTASYTFQNVACDVLTP